MLCPYCLSKASGTQCPHCKETLPLLYVQRHAKPLSKEPAIISAVGFSGHGKTVYLASLLDTLESRMTRLWSRFYRQALDIDSVKTVQENISRLRKGELPESTRRNFPKPSLHLLAEMPKYGSRDLLIYDPPGEAFDTDEGIERYAHFVQRARVVLFLVSLQDLAAESRAEELFRLLNTYVLAMGRMRAKTSQQHLVVAYTKADQLLTEFKDHPAVLHHLGNSDHGPMADPHKYIETLKAVSNELANYTATTLGARGFANLVKDQFKSVSYCAVSALGNPPDDGHVDVVEPRRVADPLIWVLEKS